MVLALPESPNIFACKSATCANSVASADDGGSRVPAAVAVVVPVVVAESTATGVEVEAPTGTTIII